MHSHWKIRLVYCLSMSYLFLYIFSLFVQAIHSFLSLHLARINLKLCWLHFVVNDKHCCLLITDPYSALKNYILIIVLEQLLHLQLTSSLALFCHQVLNNVLHYEVIVSTCLAVFLLLKCLNSFPVICNSRCFYYSPIWQQLRCYFFLLLSCNSCLVAAAAPILI